jgi:hypothetical protein
MRSANHKLTRWVDVVPGLHQQVLGNHPGNHQVDHVLADFVEHGRICLIAGSRAVVGRGDELIVLGRNHDGMNPQGLTVIVIFDGYLRLGVGTQVRNKRRLLFTDFGELLD